jgi:hypothetical protein
MEKLDWKEIISEFENCVLIIALCLLAYEAMQWGVDGKEICIGIASGLVGYLSKRK